MWRNDLELVLKARYRGKGVGKRGGWDKGTPRRNISSFGKFRGGMIDNGESGKHGFGNQVWKFTSSSGHRVLLIHSKYSDAMRRGSALSGYSSVHLWNPGSKSAFADVERNFRGESHLDRAKRHLKRVYGIEAK